jgi:tRNA (mo5U34)-methyltransferase
VTALVHRRRRRKQLAVASVDHWWHSFDFGDGVVATGTKTLEQLRAETASLLLPPLGGKTVLDIGAWDGYFAFEAERRGAARVVALDHFMWCVDRSAVESYARRCYAEGHATRPWNDVPEIWRDGTPGKRGFDVAHELLGSRVESVVDDFMTMDLDTLGAHDVVLFLGVLYHLRDPLLGLERLRAVTREVAIIETQANLYAAGESHALFEFLERDELADDVTNFWVPNLKALIDLCLAAGFREVRVCQGPPADLPGLPVSDPIGYRAVVHAIP